jgi:hypothetical protein
MWGLHILKKSLQAKMMKNLSFYLLGIKVGTRKAKDR